MCNDDHKHTHFKSVVEFGPRLIDKMNSAPMHLWLCFRPKASARSLRGKDRGLLLNFTKKEKSNNFLG